jgi:putative transposase
VLDDFSHYIVAWRLGPTMCTSDVTATLDQALAASGLDHVTLIQRPRLLSDNGSSYVDDDLATWLKRKNMQHVRGTPYHPQTHGKIERWHQTLKNRILLDNYYLPGDLERKIAAFVEHYNHVRYHESIDNSRPPTSTLAEPRQSWLSASVSSVRLLQTVACSTGCRPPKL